jgi:hypothetical protein
MPPCRGGGVCAVRGRKDMGGLAGETAPGRPVREPSRGAPSGAPGARPRAGGAFAGERTNTCRAADFGRSALRWKTPLGPRPPGGPRSIPQVTGIGKGRGVDLRRWSRLRL